MQSVVTTTMDMSRMHTYISAGAAVSADTAVVVKQTAAVDEAVMQRGVILSRLEGADSIPKDGVSPH